MPGVKQASKRKRMTKAVPALGAVGLTFSLVGGASASAVPTADTPPTPNMAAQLAGEAAARPGELAAGAKC